MAKFAVALLFLFFVGVTLGSTVDDLMNDLADPLEKDMKKCDTLISKMTTDNKTLSERLTRNKKTVTSTIDTELREFETQSARWIKQYPKRATTIKSKLSEIQTEAKNHIRTASTCMEKIVNDLTTRFNETAINLRAASKNISRTLAGLEACSKNTDNDWSAGRCGLRYTVSRKCDYLDGVATLLVSANELHSDIELAIVRMDNTCGLTKAGIAFRRTTSQAETDMRKIFHSG